ncbi:hypothetical protein [Mucilaginibacter sp. FT3.2]|uniref:hypothetical protein n=1 Tax=Mucilaginibacter sp. FT3.2 TaxID=2723090 RepID=UPI00161C1391|nr:hypothetical protein [Mucilaginibacter sp. FT3.2]MBB6232738.1 hypothetical protein [Mucilaginibacter sp. FT3.2]
MKQQVIEDVNIMPQLDRACGLDMHKDKIVGFISGKDGSNQEFREFGTYTCELKEIRDWLQENDIHHCLMESTGIYWMSLYAILEKNNYVDPSSPIYLVTIINCIPAFTVIKSKLAAGVNQGRFIQCYRSFLSFCFAFVCRNYFCASR